MTVPLKLQPYGVIEMDVLLLLLLRAKIARWAVGLHVCPSAQPACTRVPRKPRTVPPPLRRRPQPVCACRPTVRPSKPRPPVLTHRDSPILIYRLYPPAQARR